MLRKCLCFGLLAAILFGCAKKKATQVETSPDTAPVANTSSKPDSPAVPSAVVIKLLSDKVGSKRFVTELRDGTLTTAISGKLNKSVSKQKYEKNEYIEEIQKVSKGELFPTRFTRIYRTAERRDGKATQQASYVGKTLEFEKTFGHYSVLLNKNTLPIAEDQEFREMLEKSGRNVYSTWVPLTPVRVNEPWQLEESAFKNYEIGMGLKINKPKSQNSGVLTRMYYKGNKLFGAIEFNFEVVIEGKDPTSGLTSSGSFHQTVNLDAVIDGSSEEAVVKRSEKGKWEMKGVDVVLSISHEDNDVETITPLVATAKN